MGRKTYFRCLHSSSSSEYCPAALQPPSLMAWTVWRQLEECSSKRIEGQESRTVISVYSAIFGAFTFVVAVIIV